MNKAIGISVLAGLMMFGCARFHPQPLSPRDTAEALEGRSFSNPELQNFVRENLHPEAANSGSITWDFDALLLAAIYYNPDLEVARAHWKVAQAEVITAGGRPNPTVSVVPEYDFTPTSGMSPWLPSINFDLPIETAGKRGYRVARSEHLSEAARLNISSTAWQVRSKLRLSLLQLSAAQQRTGVLRRQFSAQEQLVKLLQQRLGAGVISRMEISAPQLALAKTRMDLIEGQRQELASRADVAEAVGVTARALSEIEVVVDLPKAWFTGGESEAMELRREALQSRPDILGSLAEYASSQSALQLELAKQYPDVHLGTGYQWDQGENKWQLGLTAEIPVLNRNQGPIAEAEGRRSEAAAKMKALQAKVITDFDRAYESLRMAEKALAGLEELADSARRQQEGVESQMRAGGADQVDLLNAKIEFETSELARVNLLIKTSQALADLENIVQRPIDLPTIGPGIGAK